MNISIVTTQTSVDVPLHLTMSITPAGDGSSFVAAEGSAAGKALVLLRPDRGSVVIMSHSRVARVSINGATLRGGVGRVQDTAVISVHGSPPLRFGLLFDDGVLTVPAGEKCDICGKSLEEEGLSHCRKRLCRACIDVFGGTCPDCRKNLLTPEDTTKQTDTLRSFLGGEDS
jgi:hypothetical protein